MALGAIGASGAATAARPDRGGVTLPELGPGAVIEGPASHYLGPDDNRPVNPKTGGKVEVAAEVGTMAHGVDPTAAMRSVPLGSKVRVTNLTNRKSIVVRINDRGPFKDDRVIDLTWEAFKRLESDEHKGILPRVRVEVLPPTAKTSWPERKLTVDRWAQIAATLPAHERGKLRAPPARPAVKAKPPPMFASYIQFVGISLPSPVTQRVVPVTNGSKPQG